MCGGRGTRLDAAVEKPLFEVGERPMLDRVLDALAGSEAAELYAAVSPHAPATREHLVETHSDRVEVVDTAGEGYVADLTAALETVGTPVLTVAADLPLLAPEHVDCAIDATRDEAAGGGTASVTVCVPVALKRLLGASVDEEATIDPREGTATSTATGPLAPTGLNVVADSETETMHVSYDARLAFNVNRHSDAELAERLLDDGREGPGGTRS